MLLRFLENKETVLFSRFHTSSRCDGRCLQYADIREALTRSANWESCLQKDFFNPILSSIDPNKRKYYQDELKKLERTVVFRSPISPMGHLKFCLEYAAQEVDTIGGVLHSIKGLFGSFRDRELLGLLRSAYQFRNKYVAHQEHAVVPKELARGQLHDWIRLLFMLHDSRRPERVLTRYRELVDKMYLKGLSGSEVGEMELLSSEIDTDNEYFYGPIIEKIKQAVSAKKLD